MRVVSQAAVFFDENAHNTTLDTSLESIFVAPDGNVKKDKDYKTAVEKAKGQEMRPQRLQRLQRRL